MFSHYLNNIYLFNERISLTLCLKERFSLISIQLFCLKGFRIVQGYRPDKRLLEAYLCITRHKLALSIDR